MPSPRAWQSHLPPLLALPAPQPPGNPGVPAVTTLNALEVISRTPRTNLIPSLPGFQLTPQLSSRRPFVTLSLLSPPASCLPKAFSRTQPGSLWPQGLTQMTFPARTTLLHK